MVSIERILFPTDFSEFSKQAVTYACTLADKFDAEIHLLHVLESHPSATPVFAGGLALAPNVQESRDAVSKQLESVLDEEWQQGKRVVRSIGEGAVFLEIIRYARDNQVDLIVMGTHGRSGLAHVLMGSVAERVVRKSPCPVLTVRSEEHQFEMP